jgi:hypothetical protein
VTLYSPAIHPTGGACPLRHPERDGRRRRAELAHDGDDHEPRQAPEDGVGASQTTMDETVVVK